MPELLVEQRPLSRPGGAPAGLSLDQRFPRRGNRRAARQSRGSVPPLPLPHHHELRQSLPQEPQPVPGHRRDQEADGRTARVSVVPLRLAENFRAAFYAPFYATLALGFYADEGVEIELVDSAIPGDGVAGLLDGSVDVTWGGPMRVMKAREQNPDSTLVCFGEVVGRD